MIKFVGHERLPQPLRPEEVNRLLGIADEVEETVPKEEIPFLVGQAVAITEGPFTDFNGTVEEVMADKGKVRVSVSLFGRPDDGGVGLPAAEGLLSGRTAADTHARRLTTANVNTTVASCRRYHGESINSGARLATHNAIGELWQRR